MTEDDGVLPPSRIVVAGASGSGKTTLALRIAAVLGIPHVEIDGLHHLAGWTPNPDFEEEVRRLAVARSWVTEWQYEVARPVLAERAELLVWIDPLRLVVLARVIRRTLRRRLLRVELWNGNVEPPLRSILTDPDHIVRWSWRTYPLVAPRVRAALAEHPGLRMVRVRSGADRRRLLRLLVAKAGSARPRGGLGESGPKRPPG